MSGLHRVGVGLCNNGMRVEILVVFARREETLETLRWTEENAELEDRLGAVEELNCMGDGSDDDEVMDGD